MPDDTLERLFGELAGADLPVPPPAAVVARGRQRRRRARGKVIAAVAGTTALLGVAVGQLTGFHAAAQSPATRHGRPSAVCHARSDSALTAELGRALPITGQSGTVPITVSADGSTAYVLTTIGGFHGIAEESVATGVTRKIASLPPYYHLVEGALGPDGELVSAYTVMVPGTFLWSEVLVWSPEAGIQALLEPAGTHGLLVGTPVFSGRSNELVAWEQEDGTQLEIVEANLVTKTVDVIARGYVGPPVFVGNSLVWSVADGPGQLPTRLVARSAAEFPAQRETRIPAALRAVSQPVFGTAQPPGGPPTTGLGLVVSYGGATAYLSAPAISSALTELYYSPAPSVPARLVLRLTGTSTFAPGSLVIGAGFLGWSVISASPHVAGTAMTYMASTASLAAASIRASTNFGGTQPPGRFAIVAINWDAQQGSPRLSVLSGATIKRLVCATTRPAGR